jgi:two-component system, chemotaxis family, CheB/CheR fusion protein
MAKKKATPSNKRPGPKSVETESCPVVGIGASAGGLEAFTKLLQHVPANTGMAFVLIQHLDPNHESILATLLSRATKMGVREATNQMRVEPNHVYVMPPNANMTIDANCNLQLTRRLDGRIVPMPVDHFFQSLAASQKNKAIGVILSGTASDGTTGLRAIKGEGGITFAQDQSSAKFDGMPRSAIAANVVDFILTPEEIAKELVNISQHPYVNARSVERAAEVLLTGKNDFGKIFGLLRARTGSDFSAYKRGTIERRVRRRMVLRKIEKLADYVKFLQTNRSEVTALYEDLLINVTEFFRDPQTFEVLKKDIFPKLIKGRAPGDPIRIWSAGCSTGEEAYSIVMLLADFLAERSIDTPMQMFGTDISDVTIAKARRGLYPESAVAKIPKDLLTRYFNKSDHSYRIGKRIRDLCLFARQDLTKDPPFAKVDLISCRNLLIYLDVELQNKLGPIFHYALKPDGYLLLGSSETLGSTNLFTVVDKTHKIYAKKQVSDVPPLHFPVRTVRENESSSAVQEETWTEHEVQREADRIVMAKYAPPAVVVDEQMEIVQFRGNMSPYLQPAAGAASLNLLKMVREDILPDLRATIDMARRGPAPVRREGLRNLNLEVIPIDALADRERLFLVLFEAVSPGAEATPAKAASGKIAKSIEALKRELATAKEHLQVLMDERQASEEELRSANEEILSSNEELQSTNEELETSQEELQSANEELTTVNDELQHRNTDLSQLSNDLSNLLNSVNIPIVMLDNGLRVRHFTPTAERVLNLRQTDVGRPIAEIRSNLDLPDLESLLSRVIADLTPLERDVQDRNGAWYSMRIRPYRTEDNKIDGAVMVLYDVEQLKRSLQEVRQARNFSQAIVETVPGPLVVLDSDLRVLVANRAFYDALQLPRQGTEGRPLYELAGGQWSLPALREKLEQTVAEDRSFEDFEIAGDFARVGKKIFLLQGSRLDLGADQPRMLLLALMDITSQRMAEEKMRTEHSTLERSLKHAESSLRESAEDLRHSRGELRELAARLLTTQEEERRRVSRELHDDLNQKLAMLEVDADRLGQQKLASPEIRRDVQSLRDRTAEVSNDIRRVAYQLHPSILDHLGLHVALRSYCAEFTEHDGVQVKFSGQEQDEPVPEDIALCLYRVTQESLRNVAKHAAAKAAAVTLEVADNRIHLSIKDNGAGFDTGAKHKGGIGLLSMKERVRLVDGEFVLKSKPGRGTRIDVWAPLRKGES